MFCKITATATQFFHDAALMGFFHVNGQVFVWLVTNAVYHFEHNADGKLPARSLRYMFSIRIVRCNSPRPETSAGVIVFHLFDAQRHVDFSSRSRRSRILTCGHEFTFAACQWRLLAREVHRRGWLVNFQHWQQRFDTVWCADKMPDRYRFVQNDVTGLCF